MKSKMHARFVATTALALMASNWMIQVGAAEYDPRLVVQYTDLNLTTAEDARRLYSRLKAASRAVCSDFLSRELNRLPLRKECYAKALDNAVANVNHATVSALHAANGNIRIAQRAYSSEPRT
jgi:UrcA family protein